MNKLALHWKIIIGLFLGVIYAYIAVQFGLTEFTSHYIKPIGDIFIKLMKMIAAPLVLFSIICGVASMKDLKKLGSLGTKTLGMYIITTLFSVTLGLVLVNIFMPGKHITETLRKEFRIDFELWQDAISGEKIDDVCLICDSENQVLVDEIKQKRLTEANSQNLGAISKIEQIKNKPKSKPLDFLVDSVPSNIFASLSKTAMLQIIFFALLFGVILNLVEEEKTTVVRSFISGMESIFVKTVLVIMEAMPIFVFALVAGQIVEIAGSNLDKMGDIFMFLIQYGAVLILGLGLMVVVVYPLVLKIFSKNFSYQGFFRGIRDAQITAFSTASSLATLPVTMECMHKKLKVSQQTTSFVLPIGATINMDGTSMYQAIAVVSLAQLHMIDLTLEQQLLIVSTATLASIGAAAIPSAGLVLLILILEEVGLNPLWIALIFPVDRLLDMCRTVVNVTGDATVSIIMDQQKSDLASSS